MKKDNSKTKRGFNSIKKSRNNSDKTTKSPLQKAEKTVIKPITKIGRPSSKDPNIRYVKIGGMVRESTKEKMKLSLLTSCKNKHKTQEELIEYAILFYLKSIEN